MDAIGHFKRHMYYPCVGSGSEPDSPLDPGGDVEASDAGAGRDGQLRLLPRGRFCDESRLPRPLPARQLHGLRDHSFCNDQVFKTQSYGFPCMFSKS